MNNTPPPQFKYKTKKSFKLGKRLQQIENMVALQQYNHIWDCCCDHGLLGFSLLARENTTSVTSNNALSIHFVDIVPELMAKVENKLKRFYSANMRNSSNHVVGQVHCLDVAKLPLAQYTGKHLIIIAGVGGDLIIKFIEAIHKRFDYLDIDFLLCSVHHQYSLRSKLIELDFSLKDEVLLEENKRFYEILLVSTVKTDGNKISFIGDKIWQPLLNTDSNQQTDIARRYLSKTLQHYQRMQHGFEQNSPQTASQVSQLLECKDIDNTSPIQRIINAYSALLL